MSLRTDELFKCGKQVYRYKFSDHRITLEMRKVWMQKNVDFGIEVTLIFYIGWWWRCGKQGTDLQLDTSLVQFQVVCILPTMVEKVSSCQFVKLN